MVKFYLIVRLGDGKIRTHWEFLIWVGIVFVSQVRRWENQNSLGILYIGLAQIALASGIGGLEDQDSLGVRGFQIITGLYMLEGEDSQGVHELVWCWAVTVNQFGDK